MTVVPMLCVLCPFCPSGKQWQWSSLSELMSITFTCTGSKTAPCRTVPHRAFLHCFSPSQFSLYFRISMKQEPNAGLVLSDLLLSAKCGAG